MEFKVLVLTYKALDVLELASLKNHFSLSVIQPHGILEPEFSCYEQKGVAGRALLVSNLQFWNSLL